MLMPSVYCGAGGVFQGDTVRSCRNPGLVVVCGNRSNNWEGSGGSFASIWILDSNTGSVVATYDHGSITWEADFAPDGTVRATLNGAGTPLTALSADLSSVLWNSPSTNVFDGISKTLRVDSFGNAYMGTNDFSGDPYRHYVEKTLPDGSIGYSTEVYSGAVADFDFTSVYGGDLDSSGRYIYSHTGYFDGGNGVIKRVAADGSSAPSLYTPSAGLIMQRVTAGGDLIIGQTNPVRKVDTSGAVDWSYATFGNHVDYDESGNIHVLGIPAALSPQQSLIKLNGATGAEIATYSYDMDGVIESIASGVDGKIYVCGTPSVNYFNQTGLAEKSVFCFLDNGATYALQWSFNTGQVARCIRPLNSRRNY